MSRSAFFTLRTFISPARTSDDKGHELQLGSSELELGLNERQLEAVLRYETRQEIEEWRAAVGKHTRDAETTTGGGR